MKKVRDFFKGVAKEVKKIKWPTAKEMAKGVVTTFVFCLFFCGFFYLIDFLFALLKGALS